jgi:hypothetical protein
MIESIRGCMLAIGEKEKRNEGEPESYLKDKPLSQRAP